jgi:salicylate hydroxylase
MNICIVGAGLGGLSAALALLQKGFRVTVLEQAAALGEIGAGVQLGPNAVGVLYRMGLQAPLEQVTCETLGKRVRLWNTGQTWPLFDLGTVAREMYGYPYLTVHRADLHRVLVDAVRALQPDALVLNAKLHSLHTCSDGVSLQLADGRVWEADAVIGADGVHSRVRAALFGEDAPRYSGVMAWRGVIDASKLPTHMREPYGTNWVGPGAHVVQYPLRQGALMNFVGAIEGNRWEIESWSERGTREECLGDFVGWHEEVQAMIHAIEVPYKWVLKVRDPMDTWSQGSVTLLGDACHPTLPFLAQGAAMAMEDGYMLARAMALCPTDAAQGFARYEAVRKERTARVVEGSAANTKRFHNPALAHAQGAAEYVEREWNEARVKERYEWLFKYDIDAVAL